jgi:site-specific DNA recombinase
MNLRCATYARYSSDHQSPLSIGDQVRKCREYAAQQGWSILDDHLYSDAEVSGAGTDRPGLQRLLKATQERPRPFDVLLIDDTSRLSRRAADQSNIVDQLRFAGFRLISVSQGIDSDSEQADVLMTVHGLVDSLYIKELGKKTHRGLEGRALSGLHTGGRCFGYQLERVETGGVRQKIDPDQAKTVVRIFEMSADGLSLKKIAKELNAAGVPTSRPRAGKKYASWCPTALRAMLRNETYAGRIVWNRAHFIKRPGTNKRVRRERPKAEWKIFELPELRIVTADLWRRVAERQRMMMETYGKAGAGVHKASSSQYLLTGFLKCGVCGANVIIVGGKGRNTPNKQYGCSQHHNRGACSNGLRIPKETIERNLFAEIQEKVLTADVVGYVIKQFTLKIREGRGRVAGEVSTAKARQRQIQDELMRLTNAIAETGHSRFVADAITEREREFDSLAAKIANAGRGTLETFPGNLRAFVTNGLKNLTRLLSGDTTRARAELAKYTTEIKMIPEADQKGELHYVAEGGWNLFGGIDFALVAGEGFEPSTFGL